MSEKDISITSAGKADQKHPLKNQNPNQQHNSKKEGLGPNTKR